MKPGDEVEWAIRPFTRRSVSGAIGKALQEAAGREVPYYLDVDSERGRLGVRVFADLSPAEREIVEESMRYWTPVHLAIELTCVPTSYDLRAFAEAIALGEPGAVDVFVDAAIELGIVSPERHGTAVVGHAIAWAEEVFPTVRAPPPVKPCQTCAGDCWADGSVVEQPGAIWAGPCWGQIEAIDEDYTEDDHWWIHGCEGHRDRFGRYVAPPAS